MLSGRVLRNFAGKIQKYQKHWVNVLFAEQSYATRRKV